MRGIQKKNALHVCDTEGEKKSPAPEKNTTSRIHVNKFKRLTDYFQHVDSSDDSSIEDPESDASTDKEEMMMELDHYLK